MTKQIFTKTQAISILVQIQNKETQKLNLFAPVEKNHSYYKLSCNELEAKLLHHIDSDGFAGVVEEI